MKLATKPTQLLNQDQSFHVIKRDATTSPSGWVSPAQTRPKGQKGSTMENTIDPKLQALAEKLLATREKKQEKMVSTIRAKYPHAIVDTLSYDQEARKWECAITCVVCGDDGRHVYTSDLFQINKCDKCSEEAAKAAKLQKKLELKAALELLKSK